MSESQLTCLARSGAGRSLQVFFRQLGGYVYRADDIFGYDPPLITSVEPSYALTGPVDYTFRIDGDSLGAPGSDETKRAVVGGLPCNFTVERNGNNPVSIECTGLTGLDGWVSNEVLVEVGGETHSISTIFRAFKYPKLIALAPNVGATTGGSQVSITGEEFGTGLVDIANVYIGARPCVQVTYISDRRIECRTPPGAGAKLPVVFEN